MDYAPKPTLYAKNEFSLEETTYDLYSAIAGIGHDEEVALDLLTSCTNSQRLDIKREYYRLYKSQLRDTLIDELGDQSNNLIDALLTAPYEYLARQLNRCLNLDNLENSTYIEILCTRTNDDKKKIIQAYRKIFHRELFDDIEVISLIYFRRLVELLVSIERESIVSVNDQKAKKLAEALYDSGNLTLGMDQDVFNYMLARYSFPQLRLVFDEYEQLKGASIETVIATEMVVDLRRPYKAMINCIRSPVIFLAHRLQRALTGGNDERAIIRLIVCRAEFDLENIKQEFKRLFNVNLLNIIERKTKGEVRRVLKNFVGCAKIN